MENQPQHKCEECDRGVDYKDCRGNVKGKVHLASRFKYLRVSSLGRALKPVTQKFRTGIPARFDVADGPCVLEGAIIEFDPIAKKASSIEAFRIRE